MRIISGMHKGKKIIAPSNLQARPTTDFAKEGLFNIINNHFDFTEISVLDAFAGTGNITYEFAARGAKQVIAIDNSQNCINFIQRTAKSLNFNTIKAINSEALNFFQRQNQSFDIIFCDPPYEFPYYNEILELVFNNNLIKDNGWLIIEHSVRTTFIGNEYLFDFRKYGSVCFSFFAKK